MRLPMMVLSSLLVLSACNAPEPLPVRSTPNYPETKCIPSSSLTDPLSLLEAKHRVEQAIKFGDPRLRASIESDWSLILKNHHSTDTLRYWEFKIEESDYLVGICLVQGNKFKSCVFLGRLHDFSERP